MAIILPDNKIRKVELTGDQISLIIEELERVAFVVYESFGYGKVVEILKDSLSKQNHSQQRSELNQHTAGGHDTQRASTPNRKINSGFEGIGKPSEKSSADIIVSKEVIEK